MFTRKFDPESQSMNNNIKRTAVQSYRCRCVDRASIILSEDISREHVDGIPNAFHPVVVSIQFKNSNLSLALMCSAVSTSGVEQSLCLDSILYGIENDSVYVLVKRGSFFEAFPYQSVLILFY